MLVKINLQNQIESALEKAMREAMKNVLKMGQDTVSASGDNLSVSKVSINDIAQAFADGAKSCSGDIATAIDDYIKSAQITLNTGTLMTPMPTLACAVGPVTGVITLAAPTILMNSIS